VKYTPEGGKITFAIFEQDNNVVIEITDTGYGLAPEEIPHIFEKFYRSRNPKVAQQAGSGLGLSIAQEIVQLHGGDIEVQSKLENVTTPTPATSRPTPTIQEKEENEKSENTILFQVGILPTHNGTPLRNATVRLYGQGIDQTKNTDDLGLATFSVQQGNYTVQVHAEGNLASPIMFQETIAVTQSQTFECKIDNQTITSLSPTPTPPIQPSYPDSTLIIVIAATTGVTALVLLLELKKHGHNRTAKEPAVFECCKPISF
jgi:hypothetical protein